MVQHVETVFNDTHQAFYIKQHVSFNSGFFLFFVFYKHACLLICWCRVRLCVSDTCVRCFSALLSALAPPHRLHHWYTGKWLLWAAGLLGEPLSALWLRLLLYVKRLAAGDATFTVAAPVPETGPCLFTHPATVTAALVLHCTRPTAAVSGWLFSKPRRRHRFMLEQFVVITTDDWVADHWQGFVRNGRKSSIIYLHHFLQVLFLLCSSEANTVHPHYWDV